MQNPRWRYNMNEAEVKAFLHGNSYHRGRDSQFSIYTQHVNKIATAV